VNSSYLEERHARKKRKSEHLIKVIFGEKEKFIINITFCLVFSNFSDFISLKMTVY